MDRIDRLTMIRKRAHRCHSSDTKLRNIFC